MITVGSRLTIVTEEEVVTCVVKRIRLRGETDPEPMVVVQDPDPAEEPYYKPSRPDPDIMVHAITPHCKRKGWDGICDGCPYVDEEECTIEDINTSHSPDTSPLSSPCADSQNEDQVLELGELTPWSR